MSCPHCNAPNRDKAAFCRNCGRLLRADCPRCGAAVSGGANFCDACGVPLSPQAWIGGRIPNEQSSPSPFRPFSPSPLPDRTPSDDTAAPTDPLRPLDRYIPRELLAKLTAARGAAGERRVVTMLFCDIQGSTSQAEQLDPEEWTEIINGAFEQMVRPIYKYEGTVARLMGDGLLAFFGAPIAHEDDPRRAILAGLEINQGIRHWRESLAAARELDVRVGINTGLVVVGAVGSDLRLEYSAIGDAINLAARMEQTAAPGTVQIAEDTYRLVEGQFEVEALGGIVVKGKAEPVRAFRVLRRAGDARRGGSSAMRAPLVNRRAEWEVLERSFDVLAAGRGGVLFLTGDAGLGKTRLIDEAAERLLPSLSGARLFDCAAVSYETNQPYGLISRLMRQPLGLMAGDPPERVRERVREPIAAQTDQAAWSDDDVAILETLFGVAPPQSAHAAQAHEITGEAFAPLLEATLERFWRAQAAAGPLVLALDELQWLDASSAARLAALFQLTETAPVLFLCASRRERRSNGWGLKEAAGRDLPHRLTEVALHPLNDGESRMLLAELLGAAQAAGGAALPETLAAHVLAKAEGNPLFLEEVARHLVERGALDDGAAGGWAADPEALRLPDSLLALLTARIDRLDEATRRTLQAASVIGRQFTRAPLAALVDEPAILDRHLVELQRMELIREVSRLPEPEYTFNHSLTQEAVYNTILLRQRRAMHGRVAESMEARGEAEAAPILARHYLEAEMPQRALPHLLAAASAALRLHATTEAIAQYERALPIVLAEANNSAVLIEINDNHGRALELQSRFTEAKNLYEAFEQRALAQGDKHLELASLIAQGKLYSNVTPFYDSAQGRHLMERAMALALETGNQAAEVRILWNLVNVDRFDLYSLERTLANGERGVALARELGLKEELAYLLNDMGDIYATAEMSEHALQSLTEARHLWRELGNEAMLADSLTSTALWESIFGRQRTAREFAAEATSITLRLGNIWGEAYSKGVHGNILALMGEYREAMTELLEAQAKARIAGFVGGQVIVSSFLSRIYLEAGDTNKAMEVAQEGMEIGRKQLPRFAGICISRLALCNIATGNVGRAAELMADPLVTDKRHQMFLRIDINLARVHLSLAEGRHEEAAAQAEDYIQLMSRIYSDSWRPVFHDAKAQALMALGRPEEALEQLYQAVTLARASELHNVLWRFLVAAAELERTLGRHEAAMALFDEAAAEIAYLTPRWPDDLRVQFLAQPAVSALGAERG